MDLRLEQQREYLLNKIKNKSERFTNKAVQEKVDKIKRDKEEEEKIMIFYMNEKARIADEKEMDENLRRQQEKKEMKKYYDMQVEEKHKDSEFEKLLDGEQARIRKRDVKKYIEDEKRIAKIIRAKYVRNLDNIKEQMKIKEKENKKDGMSDIELAMNKEKLMKAQETLG